MKNSGIIIANKPIGISTNALIQIIKKKLDVKKVGHAGTLDPLATGVVIVLINNATKLSDYFMSDSKEYIFEIQLFKATDTCDSEGKVIASEKPLIFTEAEITKAINSFKELTYQQFPPLYSAVKINGKKLYQYARNNEVVEIKPRKVTINSIEFQSYDPINYLVSIFVSCSKGTYIRSLASDIAKKLKTIAFVTQINRVKSGNFTIEDAVNLENINESTIINNHDALKTSNWPIIYFNDLSEIKNGKPIHIKTNDKIVFISDNNKNILACYEHRDDCIFKCKRGGLNYESD